MWQQYWLDLTALSNQRYDVPSGSVGRRFLFALADILDGVVERQWNTKRFIVFMALILQCQKGVKSYHNVIQRMEHQMDLWEKGDHRALVEDTIKVNKHQQPTGQRNESAEHICQVYTHMFLQGKLRQVVGWVTGRDKGYLLLPTDTDSKTGLPVGEVLLSKHPNPTPPPESAFEEYKDLPAFIDLYITAGTVMQITSRMQGPAGPGGMEAVSW
eukprot:3710482-Ditylum_brightwellii.AAC.1